MGFKSSTCGVTCERVSSAPVRARTCSYWSTLMLLLEHAHALTRARPCSLTCAPVFICSLARQLNNENFRLNQRPRPFGLFIHGQPRPFGLFIHWPIYL